MSSKILDGPDVVAYGMFRKITTCYNVEILAQHFLAVPSALRSLQPGCLEGTEPGTFAGDPLLGAMGIECRMVEYQSRRGFLSPASARFAGAPAPPASSRIDEIGRARV